MIVITGTSKGLGRAFFDIFVRKKLKFCAVSRSFLDYQKKIVLEPNGLISLEYLDLSDLISVSQWSLCDYYDEIIFINNAGVMGTIAALEKLPPDDIVYAASVNFVAPAILAANLARNCKKLTIINISTGATDRCIHNWELYSATKAAAKAFFSVCALQDNVSLHNIDPGVMNTGMQKIIRESNFSGVKEFQRYAENALLKDPEQVANEICDRFLVV